MTLSWTKLLKRPLLVVPEVRMVLTAFGMHAAYLRGLKSITLHAAGVS